MSKLRFASALAGLAVLAACADTPTGLTPDAETPTAVASFNTTLTTWTAGQTPVPAGFRVNGNTLACAGAGVKLNIESGTPRNGSLAGGLITYSITGTTVSFTSQVPIDYAAVKGGTLTNVFTFNPAVTAASDLVTPNVTTGNGKSQRSAPAGLSHFSLCVGNPTPVVTIDADGEFTRTFDWTISKTAGTATVAANGLSATQPYTVTFSKDAGTDSDYEAAGSVTIRHPLSSGPAMSVIGVTIGGIAETLDCGAAFPIAVAANSAITCTWTAETNATAYTVTVDVDNLAFSVAGLDGQLQWIDPATANGTIAYTVGTKVNDEVEFDDTEVTQYNGNTYTNGTTLTYDILWSWLCGTGSASFNNTATIESTDEGSDYAKSSTATVSYTRPACPVDPPPPPSGGGDPTGSGTAFAFGGTQFSEIGANRWGWVLTLTDGETKTVNVYGGAGQYNLNTLVGTVTLTHTGNAVTVDAVNPANGCTLSNQAVFYSPNQPSVKDANAPGRYAKNSDALGGATAYVIVHWNYNCGN